MHLVIRPERQAVAQQVESTAFKKWFPIASPMTPPPSSEQNCTNRWGLSIAKMT
jgi:hypothetical protein